MRQHALDGEVRLTRIGGPKYRRDAVAARVRLALLGGTKRDGHRSLRRRADRPARQSNDVSVSQRDAIQVVMVASLTPANQARTKRARIADSASIEIRSHPHLAR